MQSTCQGRIQKFFKGGVTKFCHFFKRIFFPEELILSNLCNKNDSLRGIWGYVPPEIFQNLHTSTVMAILVLSEQFLGKVCSYFWPLTLNASPNMMHFVRTVSITYACLR